MPGRLVNPMVVCSSSYGDSAVPLPLSTEGRALGLLPDSPGACRLLRSDMSTRHRGLHVPMGSGHVEVSVNTLGRAWWEIACLGWWISLRYKQ